MNNGLIADQPLIMSGVSVGYGLDMMTMLNDLGICPQVRFTVDNVETMKVMVKAGMGIARVPAGTVDNQTKLGLLETLPITPKHRVAIASYPPRQGHPEDREQLRDAIKKALGT